MPKHRHLTLTESDRATLQAMRDRDPSPYLRERATALLKIADGMAPAQVARTGLYRARHTDTVYDWLNRWEAEGVAGLTVRPGRGRKPAFFPSAPRRRSRR